jgi:hypothetical protein
MNTPISYAIGAAVGGAAGYFVGSVVADYIDEKEMREHAPISTVQTTEEEEAEPGDEDEPSSRDKMTKKRQKQREKQNYTQYFMSAGRPDLAALAKKYNEGETEEVAGSIELISEDETIGVITPDANAITIISQDDFSDNQDDYEVVELSYYADDIVIGEDDNIIPDPEDIVGDALLSFGMLSGDPDIVYVRNPKTRALYEIVRMSVKYAIDSDAETPIPRKGKKRGIDFDEVNNDENDEEANS